MNIARMPRILLYPTQNLENAGDIVLKTRLPRQYLSLPLRARFPRSFLDVGFVLTIFKMYFKVGDGVLRTSRVQLPWTIVAAYPGEVLRFVALR